MPDRSPVFKTVGDVQLRLHIFNPDGHEPTDSRPAIVFFFGGGWWKGTPEQFFPHCAYLASRGMVAMAAEYRVGGRHKVEPKECLKDARSAMRWVRTRAGKLGIDPDRLLAGGGSAGGHLAACLGTTEAFSEDGEDTSVSTRPAAMVLFNPVLYVGPDGVAHERFKAYWQKLSPLCNVSAETPPAVLFFGRDDETTPPSVAQQFKERMEADGVRCDLHIYEGQGHGFFNKDRGDGSHYVMTLTEADRFLASLGYLQGEPTL